MILARKPTVTALLSVVFTALLTTALAAQAADPSLSFDCAAWKAQYQKLIEQHEQAGGLSTAARDRATDLAYAGYARCVMGGGPKGNSEAVAALEAMRLVLLNGRSVAHKDRPPEATGRR
jgi:hypothetical protein